MTAKIFSGLPSKLDGAACLRVSFTFAAAVAFFLPFVGYTEAQTLGYASPASAWSSDQTLPQFTDDEGGPVTAMPERLRRKIIAFQTQEAPGTIIIDTGNTALYLVLDHNRAIRYGVGVGREGFTWSGVKTVERKAEWPDWRPPSEMLKRRPDLPSYMAGGPNNPLGARAMYLGGTLYRIHGSNEPQSIGHAVSSGCIRMRNEDVIDLYGRVGVGTTVVVM